MAERPEDVGLSALKLARAHLLLAWERLWPLLALSLCFLAAILALAWVGVFERLAGLSHWLALAALLSLGLAAFAPLSRFRWPRKSEALRRLDHAAGLPHRPATSLKDRLSSAPADPVALALWAAHREQAARAVRNLRLGMPRPRLAERDPYALRVLVLLTVTIAFFYAGSDRIPRLARLLDPSAALATEAEVRIDAWVTPPAYTRRPPILISPSDTAASAIVVPENSILVVRSVGDSAVTIEANGAAEEGAVGERTADQTGLVEAKIILTGEASVEIRRQRVIHARYQFSVVRDQPPVIAFEGDIKAAARGAMTLGYRASDDYGVAAVELEILRTEAQDARPLYGAPKIPLPPPTSGVAQKVTRDVSDHPWAGAPVQMTLVARDGAGHEGRSPPRDAELPGRSFSKPLARALVEQRRILALDANQAERVGKVLNALMIAPELFTPNAGHYLGLRTVKAQLARATTDDDLRMVVEALWTLALHIEDGGLSDAERQLKAAQQRLREAIERGASPEELQKLTDDLRQALNRFLQDYASRQSRPRGESALRPQRSVTQDELNQMLDRLQDMAKNGARNEAEQLLSELNDILENLAPPDAGQMADDPGLEEMNRALRRMESLIRRQQRLRDQTFRKNQDGTPPDQGPSGQGEGEQLEGLAEEQGQLADELAELQRRLREKGAEMPGEGQDGLKDAEQAMRGAQGRLGRGDGEGAVSQQGQALEALRRGAQSLAETLQQAGRGQPGQGRQGQGRNGRDPFGRPSRGSDDDTVKVPGRGETPAQRAARVLEELRRRLSQPSQPRPERDYIERLLRTD